MKKYVCLICGYVHEGDSAPAVCPVCGATADKFKEMGEAAPASAPSVPAKASSERVWADEHRVGIAKGLDAEVVEMLRANFTGECSEVVCIWPCPVSRTGRAIRKSVCTGRRPLMKRPSTPRSSPNFWEKS